MTNNFLALAGLLMLSCTSSTPQANQATEAKLANAPASSSATRQGMPPLLIVPSHAGSTTTKSDSNYKGGYYYAVTTKDSAANTINTAFLTTQKSSTSLNSYIKACAKELCSGDAINDVRIKPDAALSKRLSYPVHLVEWTTGSNEDTQQFYALFMKTDTHTYMYVFEMDIDDMDNTVSLWKNALPQIKLGS